MSDDASSATTCCFTYPTWAFTDMTCRHVTMIMHVTALLIYQTSAETLSWKATRYSPSLALGESWDSSGATLTYTILMYTLNTNGTKCCNLCTYDLKIRSAELGRVGADIDNSHKQNDSLYDLHGSSCSALLLICVAQLRKIRLPLWPSISLHACMRAIINNNPFTLK